SARVHVFEPYALTPALPELARLTLLTPEERARCVAAARPADKLLLEAEASFKKGQISVALEIGGKALKLQPRSVQIQVFLGRLGKRRHKADLEAARLQVLPAQQAAPAAL